MANTYKNIIITPNSGSSTDDPKIQFSGGNTSVNTDITLRVYPLSNGALSFEGSAGQLFSITNDLSNSIFTVNDVSGIPSVEVLANGVIKLAEFGGNVGIGARAPAQKLDVAGSIKLSGAVYENVFTITDAAGFEINPANGTIQLITLGANRTPKGTNFANGQSVTLMINDGSANTLTWTDTTFGPSGVIWVNGTAPTLATTGYTVVELWDVNSQVYGALVGSVA